MKLLLLILAALLALFSTPAAANDSPRVVDYVLALAFTDAMERYKPVFMAPMKSREECMEAAEKRNRTEVDQRKALGDGAEFVCMRVERVML